MSKRNAHGLAAWRRKAGAHSKAKRPVVTQARANHEARFSADVFDEINAYEDRELTLLAIRMQASQDEPCPVCHEPLLNSTVHHMIAGRLCSMECLVRYWDGDDDAEG